MLIRVGVRAAIDQVAAGAHPIGQKGMGRRVQRLHVGIGHQQHFHARQRFVKAQILQVRDTHRAAPLEEGHRQAEEPRQRRVPLEHQRIGHEHRDARGPLRRLGHLLQRPGHHLHHGSVGSGNPGLLLRPRAHRVQFLVNALRPGHNLIRIHLGIKQLRGEGGLVVAAEVLPVPGPVFDRIGEKPYPAAGRRRHGNHAAIFQESRLEHPLPGDTSVAIEHAGGAGPHLGDVPVHAGKGRQGGFGAHNLPLGVVDERMRGNIAADFPAQAPAIFLRKCKRLIQGAIVQVILEFGRQISGLGRLFPGTPGRTVIGRPFPFEGIGIPGGLPEFRLFQKDVVHACVDDPLDMPLLEILQVILRGNDIGNHAAVPERVSGGVHLPFVQVPLPVPSAREIILVCAPGDAGHEVSLVAPRPPGGQAVFQGTAVGRTRIAAHPVHHHRIGPVVQSGTPALGGLEGGFYAIGRWGSTRSRKGQDKKERQYTTH